MIVVRQTRVRMGFPLIITVCIDCSYSCMACVTILVGMLALANSLTAGNFRLNRESLCKLAIEDCGSAITMPGNYLYRFSLLPDLIYSITFSYSETS